MQLRLGYYVVNGGDGSAYPSFYKSKLEAKFAEQLDGLCYGESWAEDSTGEIVFEADSNIKIVTSLGSFLEKANEVLSDEFTKDKVKKEVRALLDKYKAAGGT